MLILFKLSTNTLKQKLGEKKKADIKLHEEIEFVTIMVVT